MDLTQSSTLSGSSEGVRNPVRKSGRPGLLIGTQSAILQNYLYPVLIKRARPTSPRYLKELHEFEFASPEAVERAQWAKLQKLIVHAAQNVPYYRNAFRRYGIRPDEIRNREDFARVPVLRKFDVQSSCEELISENRDRKSGTRNATGGSTGKPVQFYQDGEYWDQAHACQTFVEEWWGIKPGDRTASLWGADRDIPDQSWRERMYSEIVQLRVCNAFALRSSQMDEFRKMLVRWQPRHVIGYASALEVFSRFLLEKGESRIRPLALKTTADVLTDERREVIQRAFGCPVYNFYGSREINNLAVECPALEGLHVNSLFRYIEVVDEEGNPLPHGKPGRILVTDLTNYFMPFLRYEIEDIGSWSDAPCSCGRPFRLLSKIWGRSSDFIVTPEGKLIHGEYFTHMFYDVPEVMRFQLNQRSITDVDVYVVLRPEVLDYPEALLRNRIRGALGPNVAFRLNVVSDIDRPASGKHRFTISAVRPDWSRTEVKTS